MLEIVRSYFNSLAEKLSISGQYNGIEAVMEREFMGFGNYVKGEREKLKFFIWKIH